MPDRLPGLVLLLGLWIPLAAGLPAAARAQGAPPAVIGVVTDTLGRPIQHARVVVVGVNDTVVTAADGRYSFPNLPAGRYTMRAMFLGYLREQRDSVRVVAGTSTRVDFRLRQSNCDLDCNPIILPAPTKKPQ